jgi:hypothetical protein
MVFWAKSIGVGSLWVAPSCPLTAVEKTDAATRASNAANARAQNMRPTHSTSTTKGKERKFVRISHVFSIVHVFWEAYNGTGRISDLLKF